MPERLPDLGLCIKGVKLQPGKERNIRDQRENVRVHQRAREETCSLRACVVNRDCIIAILNLYSGLLIYEY